MADKSKINSPRRKAKKQQVDSEDRIEEIEGIIKLREASVRKRLDRYYRFLVEQAVPFFDRAEPGAFEEYLKKVEEVKQADLLPRQKQRLIMDIADAYEDRFKQAILTGKLDGKRLQRRLAEGALYNPLEIGNVQALEKFIGGTTYGIVRPFSGFLHAGAFTEVDEEDEIEASPSDLLITAPYDSSILGNGTAFVDKNTGKMFTSCSPPVNQSGGSLSNSFDDPVGNRLIDVIAQIEVESAEANGSAVGTLLAESQVRLYVERADDDLFYTDTVIVKSYEISSAFGVTVISVPLENRLFNISITFPSDSAGPYNVEVWAISNVFTLGLGGAFTSQNLTLKNIIVRFLE